jgi:hypothetical protein
MLGGTLKAATHHDLIMWDSVIEVDREIVWRSLDILV